ncbi:MAG TPA: hypothetical protein PK629_12580 [Oscillospiraceae bacterium]|nr:hypothetical protein [Oscillospiraceae bacterium]
MKKIFCILLILIFLCGCATTNPASSTPISSENETIDMSFDSFGGECSDDIIEFINSPRDNQLYEDLHIVFRFEKKNGQLLLTGISSEDGSHKQGPFLALNDPDNWRWGKFKSSEYFQKAIAFLCDEDAIKQCFHENGVENIQKIVIIDGPCVEAGYVITAITETQAYFMTVPISNEKYGDYIFQKVYTQDEFLKIYSPRPAKVFINEKEVTFSTTPILGDVFLEMDLFEFLDGLGIQYTYNKDHKTISFNNIILQMDEYKDGLYDVEMFKDDSEHRDVIGEVKYVKGKCIGDLLLYDELCRALGYSMELHYDDYSIRIVKN